MTRPSISAVPVAESKTLEWLKVAARAALSPQLVRDLEVRQWQELMADQLITELRTRVLADRVEEITESDTVTTAEPRGRRDHLLLALKGRALPFLIATGGLVTLLLALSTSWLWPVVLTALATFALLAVDLCKVRWRQVDHVLTVTVGRWATFPENTMVYPKHLGAVTYMQQTVGVGKAEYQVPEREDDR